MDECLEWDIHLIPANEIIDADSQFDVAIRSTLPDTDPRYRTVDQGTALVTPFCTNIHFGTD